MRALCLDEVIQPVKEKAAEDGAFVLVYAFVLIECKILIDLIRATRRVLGVLVAIVDSFTRIDTDLHQDGNNRAARALIRHRGFQS
jgi:hypothetical protein